jgi:hypothetical protein
VWAARFNRRTRRQLAAPQHHAETRQKSADWFGRWSGVSCACRRDEWWSCVLNLCFKNSNESWELILNIYVYMNILISKMWESNENCAPFEKFLKIWDQNESNTMKKHSSKWRIFFASSSLLHKSVCGFITVVVIFETPVGVLGRANHQKVPTATGRS